MGLTLQFASILLKLRLSRGWRHFARLCHQLAAAVAVFAGTTPGWTFEAAEGHQSRYGFSGDLVATAALVERIRALQHTHRSLITGQAP
jgi:hypothetical protein